MAKAANKAANKAAGHAADGPVELTVEEKLDGLIAFLKAHGLHYDGSPAPSEEEDVDGDAEDANA